MKRGLLRMVEFGGGGRLHVGLQLFSFFSFYDYHDPKLRTYSRFPVFERTQWFDDDTPTTTESLPCAN